MWKQYFGKKDFIVKDNKRSRKHILVIAVLMFIRQCFLFLPFLKNTFIRKSES